MSLIEVEHVSKEFKVYKRQKGVANNLKSLFVRSYETKNAVNDISFSVKQGEMVGYIGANGAGKSTTIKMLSGILLPSSGRICVDGIVPYEDRKKNAHNIGVVFGQRSQLNWDLPMEDTFELYKRMYRVDDASYRRNVDMFVNLMQMQDFLRKPVRQLSLGQKMRAELAISLLHDPKLLYLDEPTIGLDVLVKDKIRKFIKTLNAEKKVTVILTTHDMNDIDQICDRIIMIDRGKILSDDSLQMFKESHRESYLVRIEYEEIFQEPHMDGIALKSDKDGVREYVVEKRSNSVNEILRCFGEAFRIKDISIKENDIEEIVRRLYEALP